MADHLADCGSCLRPTMVISTQTVVEGDEVSSLTPPMAFPPTIPEGARSVQSSWPDLTCFGCGPANPDGLHLESYVDGDALVAEIEPDSRYQISPDFLYGGTIASLMDCHGVWTAMTFMAPPEKRPPDHPPASPFVTGELTVRYESPTPVGVPMFLRGRLIETAGRRATAEVEFGPSAGVTARGRVVAISLVGYDEETRPHSTHRPPAK